jgi:hypothetical protein
MRVSLRACGTVAIAGFAFLELSATSVQAQGLSACVQNCSSGGWSYSQCTRYCQTTAAANSNPVAVNPGPRVYGYYYRSQGQSGGCGQFRYLRGGQCVDARIDPPNLR